MENRIKMDDLGFRYFRKHPYGEKNNHFFLVGGFNPFEKYWK